MLANRHVVPPDQLMKFSRKIHSPLSPGFDPELPEHRSAKTLKGEREAVKAVKHLTAASRELEKAQAILDQLHFKDAFAHIGRPNPADKYREDLVGAVAVVRAVERYVEVMERHHFVIFKGAPDLRVVRDIRREAICFAAFSLWLDLDRPLTYTTDPQSSERGGKLFSFMRDVVSRLTESITILSDAALRADLERYKAPNPV